MNFFSTWSRLVSLPVPTVIEGSPGSMENSWLEMLGSLAMCNKEFSDSVRKTWLICGEIRKTRMLAVCF